MSNTDSSPEKASGFPWKENAAAEQDGAKPAARARKAYNDMQSGAVSHQAADFAEVEIGGEPR